MNDRRRRLLSTASLLGGLLGVFGFLGAAWQLNAFHFNVSNYTVVRAPEDYLPAVAFHWLLVATTLVVPIALGRGGLDCVTSYWPLGLSIPFGLLSWLGHTPPFWCALLLVLGCGLAVCVCQGKGFEKTLTRQWLGLGAAALILMIALNVIVHAQIQKNLYDHCQLGHADFGHFLEELKNCLAGRGLRSDSFPNTRLGWHFTPLFFAMVPLYWLWPSVWLLFIAGPLLLYLPALVIYWFASRETRSVECGLVCGFAWLALPSLSRMVYSNSYGFQWDYVVLSIFSLALVMLAKGHVRAACVCLALTCLTVETAAPAVIGVGLACLVQGMIRLGSVIVAGATMYLVICIQWLIPSFAVSGTYERTELFGELGNSLWQVLVAPIVQPGEVASRLARRESGYYLAMLLIPMCGLPLAAWRWSLGAAPVLMSILLLANKEWLSIKFWHQGTVIAIFFCAAVSLISGREGRDRLLAQTGLVNRRGMRRTAAWGILVSALWAHLLFGFSPVSNAFGAYANEAALHRPDPRLEAVQSLRATIVREKTILASERMAAHFWDYRRIYTGRRIMPADYVIIDRSDTWDATGLPQMVEQFRQSGEYRFANEFGPVLVLARNTPVQPTD